MKYVSKLWIIGIGLFVSILSLPSQDKAPIVIEKAPGLDQLMGLYAAHHQSIEELPGYRIQILASTSSDKAYKAETEFKRKFYGQDVYLTYTSPYFKLRVGDFTDKLEAYRFLQQLKSDYPGSFMVEEPVEAH